ncbi:hypothetical protein CKO28_07580 [Rhodovibrio sodomensis]|uniref:DUF4197 domain-containing protein n=1 Tax=Rhodovibrio sodomensis TaxID=1088 RepID=A0ABS1DDD7_9PROT|nr:DUF4197 domain-containing protein [Rhodovibrio sodomensis]MBK1667894.1 hypothetical protein [Rhodovibrio sodomensis]
MPRAPLTRRSLLALLPLAAGGAVLSAGRARADWLDRGTKLFNDLTGESGAGGLSEGRIVDGLRQALRVASRTVVDRVGQPGGYLDDPRIHIPLPDYLAKVRPTLSMLGMGGLLDDVETRLNRGAEQAAPEAQRLFLDAIAAMTIEDARGILDGPDDAATQYFRRTMGPELREAFRPIVESELEQAGAVAAVQEVAAGLDSVPFAGSLGAQATDRLVGHGLDGALDGLFHYLAKQEAAIRTDPAARTTEVLQEVFG